MALNPEQSALIDEKSRVVTLSLAIGGLAGILAGSAFQCSFLNVDIDALVSNTGALFLVIAVLQWFFDRNVRESFFTNIHREIVGSSRVQEAGICNFYPDSKDVDFTEDFLTSTGLVIGTNYSPKLIDNCIGLLQERSASGKNTVIIRMAPDGHAAKLMAHEFFDGDNSQIIGGHSKMDGIVSDINKEHDTIRVFFADTILKYSFVAFDSRIWVVFGTNGLGRRPIPGFLVRANGTWFQHFKKDIDLLCERADACQKDSPRKSKSWWRSLAKRK